LQRLAWGKELLKEKQHAESDKEEEETSVVSAVSSELKPGERKIISDGTDGPVVEIIKRGGKADSEEADYEDDNLGEDEK